jgi:3-methyladenine DNA glycosylase AlkC
MTQVKERAFELLKNMGDEKNLYVIKFIQAINDDSESVLSEQRKAAFKDYTNLKKILKKPLSPDFDYKKELAVYQEERYGYPH